MFLYLCVSPFLYFSFWILLFLDSTLESLWIVSHGNPRVSAKLWVSPSFPASPRQSFLQFRQKEWSWFNWSTNFHWRLDPQLQTWIWNDLGFNTWVREIPGEGNGNLLQCLENSMDRGAWRAVVHGVAKSQMQLTEEHFHFQPSDGYCGFGK